MILTCVSIYDKAAAAYMRPWFAQAQGVAIRQFTDEVNRSAQDNPLWMHPADYDLYLLGTWDDATGEFTLLAKPELVLNGRQVVKPA